MEPLLDIPTPSEELLDRYIDHLELDLVAERLGSRRSLSHDRLAVYSFAYMPEVLKHQKRMPADALPGVRIKRDLLRAAYEGFVRAGYRPIGMDPFAVPEARAERPRLSRTV